jgi:uncharacterized protein
MDDARLATILKALTRHFPNAQGLWVFGSFATQEQTAASDLDLAILLPPEAAQSSTVQICRQELMEQLDMDVDLIDLRHTNTVFQNEIVSHGHVLHAWDTKAVQVFEMLSLSLWQKLNQERAGIMSDILASGRILA